LGITVLGDDLYCHEPFCRALLATEVTGLPKSDIKHILQKVSYSKDYKKEAGILKIDLFSTLKKSPNRWRYSRYEEA
jgi:hypothetical protein